MPAGRGAGRSATLDVGALHQLEGAKIPNYVVCGKAVLPVDATLAHDLSDAGQVKIAITTRQGKVTEISMGIDGISAAMAALAP